MANNGVIIKRCGCRDPHTRTLLEATCPRLGERRHGSWYFHCNVTTLSGRRERVRRGGFATRADAEAARDDLLARSCAESTGAVWTVERWLRYWLTTRISIRPSTLRSYAEHVNNHLVPYLGRIRLAELTGRGVTAMFTAMAAADNRWGRRPAPSTLHRIRATLRAALNAAIRDGLICDNPARFVELPTPRRPQAQVWTEHRTREWRRTGQRFQVAVWTAAQVGQFLRFVQGDRLYAMWWLIALRGLRRGEAAGLRWVDVDLDNAVVMISQQRITYGSVTVDGPPKTAASRRTIALDRATVAILRQHRRRQEAESRAAGIAPSGYVFTDAAGRPLNPDYLTRRFKTLVDASGLPPVRLHDLRHGAATLAHAVGADLKTVQEFLGHTSIVLIADTYTSVLMQMHFTTAEAVARLVLAAAAINPGRRRKGRRPGGNLLASAAPSGASRPQPLRPKRNGRRRKVKKGRTPATHR